ncbi:amino acid ABC transporter permease [Ornithinimicrobium pratense]|uniref:Amino acid ABC transporter permease n=1 Tax=Ornithinimicrobium pratense TaxID=2593973 RepID=A0A5J6V6L7_9MICO|nr:amino acid ABC transporter permease [Ornithinimicrobium pratense]QFG69428.1 amino acid ABC transporter permease [Ornithinimicrobium pratense]
MIDLLADIGEVLPRLVREGLLATLTAFGGGALVTVVVAVILGLSLHQGPAWLRGVARVIVELFRGTSLVVQLFFLFYVLPALTGFDLGSTGAAIAALGLNYGAYGAEIVRGSLNAVPKGQWETSTALSMSWTTTMRRVIWPQAWALILPGFNNLLVMLVKGTAVVSLVLMADLTFEADRARRLYGTWPAYLAVLILYFLIALVVSTVLRRMERHAQRKLGLRDAQLAKARTQADRAMAGAAAAGGSTGMGGGLGTAPGADEDADRKQGGR